MLKKIGNIRVMCPDEENLMETCKDALRGQFGYDCIINHMDIIQINEVYYNVHYEVE